MAITTEHVAIAAELPGDQSGTSTVAHQSQSIPQVETPKISHLKEARVSEKPEMQKDKDKEVSSPTLNLINFPRLSPSTSKTDMVDSRRGRGVSQSLPHDREGDKYHTQ